MQLTIAGDIGKLHFFIQNDHVQVGDIKVGVINMYTVFKAKRLAEIAKEMDVDREVPGLTLGADREEVPGKSSI